ncbi:MAG TPA: CBS domain-containing protein [Longimicrobiales bacterium]|nr:CBS domain-containing protein [Longimicrobiales bacterium]
MTMTVERKQSGDGGGIDRNRVRLISQVVEIGDRTGRALDIMNEARLDFLPVVAEDTGKLLGVVLRKGIERGCWGMGHDPDLCAMQNHLKTGVRFTFEDEPLDSGTLKASETEPVVVVDRQLRPVGILEGDEER